MLATKYAAFIRRETGRKVEALVLTYETVEIIVVKDAFNIPKDALSRHYTYPPIPESKFSQSTAWHSLEDRSQKDIDDEIRAEVAEARAAPPLVVDDGIPRFTKIDPPLAARPPPFLLTGDFVVEVGPLVNRDQMKADLLFRHGDLKAASIAFVDSSPRGPPDKEFLAARPIRTIYIVGKISKFTGPVQRDESHLDARIVDLGPTETAVDNYIDQYSEWKTKIDAHVYSGHERVSPPPNPVDRTFDRNHSENGHAGEHSIAPIL